MRTIKQEDYSGETHEGGHRLTSSGQGEWSTDGIARDIYMDPENPAHQECLKKWCKAHWLSTFKRSLVYGNKLTYHCCCNSFSRRRFTTEAGHPPLLSIGILQIPGLRNAADHEDLYHWLLGILREATFQRQKVLFPSLNRHHIERQEYEEDDEPQTELEKLLAKRNAELEEKLEKATKQVLELKKHNEQLLLSSKCWHEKYEELLSHGSAIITLTTPKKDRSDNVLNFSED